MKRIMIILLVIFSSMVFSVVAQGVPEDVDTMTANKVAQEHQTTRQFLSNELVKKEKEFIDEFTKRADYYEDSYEKILNGAVLKLGLLWGGVLLFFISFNKLLQTKIERQKYAVLKEAIKKDILGDLSKDKIVLPEKDIQIADDLKKQTIDEQKQGFLSKLLQKKEKAEVPQKYGNEKQKLEKLQLNVERRKKIQELNKKLKILESELNVYGR